MNLQFYLDILRRRAVLIVIVMGTALSLILVAGWLRTPVYKARATVRILFDQGIADYVRRADDNDRLMRTYEQLLSSDSVLNRVLARLEPGVTLSASTLRRQLEVEIIAETELIQIVVENEQPALARDLANLVAAALIEYTQDFYVGNQGGVIQLMEEELADIESKLEQERIHLSQLLDTGAPAIEIETLKMRISNLETSQSLRWEQYESARLAQRLQVSSITLVQPAALPREPANALGMRDLGLTLALGLAGGLGLTLVLENMDNRIRSPQQLERLTHLPTLSIVPRGKLPVSDDGQIYAEGKDSALIEAYRIAGLNLQRLVRASPMKTILITSVEPGEGKTTVATNLACVLAESGRTVFLVECDMRHSVLSKRFGIDDGRFGLSSLLLGNSSLEHIILPTEQPSLFIIDSGPTPANPALLLGSPVMDRMLHYLGEQGHITLIDTPPVLGLADVSILAPKVDGIILIAHQNRTHREQIDVALRQLKAAQANVLGAIFVQRDDKSRAYVHTETT